MAYFNPLDEKCKSQIGAIKEDTEVTFRVFGDNKSCKFVYYKDGTATFNKLDMEKKGDFFEISLSFSVGLFFYHFILDGDLILGLGENYLGQVSYNPRSFELTVYKKGYTVPEWVKGGIIYQIFPDRFCRAEKNKKIADGKWLHDRWEDTPVYLPDCNGKVHNNDFFGGDIKGIISKLPYLKDLSVKIIYLNPIFEAYSNHRYDTGDYLKIDSLLGDINDFKNLISEAEKYGIKIVIDGVFNHTGDDSIYFNKYGKYNSVGAYQSENSEYFSWYNFLAYPDYYESWWGITTLPSVNKSNDGFWDFICGENGVIDYYTKLGVGGWRLDVVDEIPAKFVKRIRKAVKKVNKDAFIIGEVWEDASNKISYGVRREYFQGEELDSVMNYPLKNAILNFVCTGNISELSNTIKTQIDHYPKFVLNSLMNILSTHDTYRLLSAVSGIETAGLTKSQMENLKISENDLPLVINRLKAASLLQFTLNGIPSIYYGDEAGMQGFSDPLNRLAYPWGNENIEILNWYKKLGKIRDSYSCFKDGDFSELYCSNGFYSYKRYNAESEVFVAINLSDFDKILSFSGKLFDLISEKEVSGPFTLNKGKLCVLVNNI